MTAKNQQILKQNLITVVENTKMKTGNRVIFRATQDLIDVYASLFTKNDLKRAKKELEAQQNISLKNAIILSLFSGGSIVQILMLIFFFVGVHRQLTDTSYYLKEFYSLDSLFRLFFVLTYLSFAAGVCIKIWRQYEINYIHILQIEFKDRLNHFQLWKISSIMFFILLSLLLVSFEEVAAIHNNLNNWVD